MAANLLKSTTQLESLSMEPCHALAAMKRVVFGETVRRLVAAAGHGLAAFNSSLPPECKGRKPQSGAGSKWQEVATHRKPSKTSWQVSDVQPTKLELANVENWTNSERFRFSNSSKHGFLHFQIQTNTRDTCDASVDCAAAQRALPDRIRDGRVGKWRPDIWETAWAMLRYCCYSPNVCICYNSPQTQMSLTAIVRDMPIKCCKVCAT